MKNSYPAWIMTVLLVTIMVSRALGQTNPNFQILGVSQVINGTLTPAPLEGLKVTFSYFNPPGGGRTPKFLSICAKVPGQTNIDWVAKNIYLDTFPGTRVLNRDISMSNLGIPDNARINAVMLFAMQTNNAVVTPITPPPTGFVTFNCPLDSIFMFDSKSRYHVSPAGPDYMFADYATGVVASVTRGCTVPNIDLNDSLNPGVRKGYAGDHNACGPASVANSLAWIQTANPAVGKDSLTDRQRLEELSELMGRKNGGGVETEDIIQGKISFIAKYGLKLKVEYLGASGNFDDDLAWLKAQYDAGQDIEMDYSFVNENGVKQSHAVVITGLVLTGRVPQIFFKDDGTQKKAGGTNGETAVDIKRSPDGHMTFIRNGRTCTINHFYAESYDPNAGAYTDPSNNTTSTVFCKKQEKDCKKGACPALIIFYRRDTMPAVTYPICGGSPCCDINKLSVTTGSCAAERKGKCRGTCPELFRTKTDAKRGSNAIQGKCEEALGCKCVYDVKGKIPGVGDKNNRRLSPENAIAEAKLKIYPNPAGQKINIAVNGYLGDYRLQVINILGQQLIGKFITLNGNEEFTLDITAFANGMYYVLLSNSQEIIGGSFVKE